MYSVMIVDDEPAIRSGLQTLIDWQQCGFRVVGSAMNGREALALHAELQPDLMLIDIRMPVMDGLQVIEEIRRTDSKCRFLILSGYADFEYARRAIAGRVDGYVLKPVDEEEVSAELVRIGKQLSKEEREQAAGSDAPGRREAWLRELLFRAEGAPWDAGDAAVPAELARLVSPAASGYQVLALRLPQALDADSGVHASVNRRLSALFEEQGRGAVLTTGTSHIVLLAGTAAIEERNRVRLHAELKMSLPDVAFYAALGQRVKRLAEAGASFRQADKLLRQYYLFGDELIVPGRAPGCVADDQTGVLRQAEPLDIQALAEKLYYAIDMGNQSSLELWLGRAAEAIAASDSSEHGIQTNYAQLISVVLNKLAGRQDHTYTVVQQFMPLVASVYDQPNFPQLTCMIKRQLVELAERMNASSSEPVLKQIVHFVERHYHENLKLDTLAELFNYTSGYLGKLFKNYTGSHFHTYLDQIRIQKAIELLGEGHKVHQVAVRVGYANADYFHQKFKKYVGESPSSYKGKK